MNKPIATRLHHGDRVPAYYCAPQRKRQSQADKDPTSVIGKYRAMQAEQARVAKELGVAPEVSLPKGIASISLGLVGVAAALLIGVGAGLWN